MVDSSGICNFCGSRSIAATLAFRKEMVGGDGGWRSVADLVTLSICEGCVPWLESTMRIAGLGKGDPGGRLGFPYSGGTKTLNAEHCNCCWAQLFTEAYAMDLLPVAKTIGAGGRVRHSGEIHAQRICRYCYAWWRTTLRDPSAVRGTSFRRDEGEMGGWRTVVARDTSSVALLERDEFTLAQTVAAIGRQHRKLSLNGGALLPLDSNEVILIGAGRRDRAAAFVERLDPRLRARVAVVGRADCMTDSFDALRLGAAELLASPLSPQQVAGLMERIARPGSPFVRGKQTGLRTLTEPRIRAGAMDEHLVTVQLAPAEDFGRGALMLRRFLRGYDEVGEDGAGGLAALVSCLAEDIGTVVDRLRTVFGEKTQVTLKASSNGQRGLAAS